MSVLNIDIQLFVVEWVYRASQHLTVDYRTLCACALVCKAWTPVAQRLLFRRIPHPIGTPAALYVQRLLLTLRGNPRLASFVRFIYLHIKLTSGAAKSLALLGLCTNVQHIYLDCDGSSSAFTLALEEQLRALHVSPVVLTLYAEVHTVKRVASIWPSVRTLKIQFDYSGFEQDNNMTQVSAPSTVRSLSVHTGGCTAWKFAQDCDFTGLRELELDAGVGLTLSVMPGVLPQLCFLSVDGIIPPQAVLDQLTQLHTLVFTVLPGERTVLLLPERTVSLPPSLSDLAYHGTQYKGFHGWCRKYKGMLDVLDKSPTLRRFTMPRGMWDHVCARFDEVCGNRGIEVITYTGQRSHEVGAQFVRCCVALNGSSIAGCRCRLDIKTSKHISCCGRFREEATRVATGGLLSPALGRIRRHGHGHRCIGAPRLPTGSEYIVGVEPSIAQQLGILASRRSSIPCNTR
ncbi:hypothetical protein FA95DRAFT_229614 [Auriscalpium vulgare]|uniref:Uncharacterized protein n=1 Tax=Auriscalpium vulgare TaxID=40419 RepID=A0ACB8RL32_9AGAM|nr:hypothetical protein FA95DRAFT_229614 [Auriscalpium vulgare]